MPPAARLPLPDLLNVVDSSCRSLANLVIVADRPWLVPGNCVNAGRLRQIRSFFRNRSPDQMLATAAPGPAPWLPPGYEQNFWNAASVRIADTHP